MAVINRPNTQIKLTNVTLVRMKKGKKRFEIACYQNKVQDWRAKVEKDLDEVIQIPQVFTNVSKGQVANNDDLMNAFGTTDQDKVIAEILEKGEFQLNEKERNANIEKKTKEFLTIISSKCINPKSNKRYPPSIIQSALTDLNFHMNPNKPTKQEALLAIKILLKEQKIPIARAQMKIKITINHKRKSLFNDQIESLVDKLEEESKDSKNSEYVCIVDPINYREIVQLLEKYKDQTSVEVLELVASSE